MRLISGSSGDKQTPLIPKAKGPYSVCRMSPLRKTYLTGCGADQRGEGKLNHCTIFFIWIYRFMKKKQQTIYVVTSGEYSDYHIEAVFTDKCKAEKYVDEDAGDSCGRRIEEFEANACQFRKEGLWREVFIPLSDKDGDIKICNSVVSVNTVCAKFRNEGQKICGYEFTVNSISAS